jgi:hypothetical protein
MIRKSILGLVLTLFVFTCGWTAARSVKTGSDFERVQLPVLKVFSAKDGKAVFRAYLVKWKDQEVIVPDPLIKSNYKEGDTASVLVMKHRYPNEKPGPDLLSFTVAPETP